MTRVPKWANPKSNQCFKKPNFSSVLGYRFLFHIFYLCFVFFVFVMLKKFIVFIIDICIHVLWWLFVICLHTTILWRWLFLCMQICCPLTLHFFHVCFIFGLLCFLIVHLIHGCHYLFMFNLLWSSLLSSYSSYSMSPSLYWSCFWFSLPYSKP